MNSVFFSLSRNDIVKGVVVVVLAAFVGAFQQALTGHGVDFGAYDWRGIFDLTWKAGAAYLIKQVLTTENGKVFGRIG